MKSSTLDAFARFLLLGLIVSVPVFLLPFPWISASMGKMLLVLGVVSIVSILWLVVSAMERNVAMPRGILVPAAGVLVVAYAVSAALSGWHAAAFWGTGHSDTITVASMCVLMALMVGVAIVFGQHARYSISALRAVMVGGLLLSLSEIIHLLVPSFLSSYAFSSISANVFGGAHELAVATGFFFLVSLGIVRGRVATGVWKVVCVMTALLSFLILVALHCGDVWLMLALCVGVLVYYRAAVIRSVSGMFFRREWPRVSLVGIYLAFALFGTSLAGALPASLYVPMNEMIPTWQETLGLASGTMRHPSAFVWGTGPGSFAHDWDAYRFPDTNETPYWNVSFSEGRGVLPTAIVTTGVIGVVAWLLFFAALLLTLHTVLCQRVAPEQQEDTETIFLPVAVAILYLVVYACLYTPSFGLMTLLCLVAGLYVALALGHQRMRQRMWHVLDRGWRDWAISLAASAGVGFVLVCSMQQARAIGAEALLMKSMDSYVMTKDPVVAHGEVETVIALNPANDEALRFATTLGLQKVQSLVMQQDLDAPVLANLKTAIQDTIHSAQKATQVDGNEYQNWLALGAVYQELASASVPGAADNAHVAYDRAHQRNPSNPSVFLNIAQLDAQQQAIPDALTAVQSALKLKPDYAPAYYLESRLYATKNDIASAKIAAEKAIEYEASNPLAWYNLATVSYQSGEYARAITAAKKVISLGTHDADTRYVMAFAYDKLGRPNNAIGILSDIPDAATDPTIQKMIAILRSGKTLDGTPRTP